MYVRTGMEEMHQQKVTQMIRSAEGSAGLLHKITEHTAWRGGAQILKKEVEYKKRNCGHTRKGGTKWKVAAESLHNGVLFDSEECHK